jgi:hypothetical protein
VHHTNRQCVNLSSFMKEVCVGGGRSRTRLHFQIGSQKMAVQEARHAVQSNETEARARLTNTRDDVFAAPPPSSSPWQRFSPPKRLMLPWVAFGTSI